MDGTQLTTQYHLLPNLRMSGSEPLFPPLVYVKGMDRDNFIFVVVMVRILYNHTSLRQKNSVTVIAKNSESGTCVCTYFDLETSLKSD